MTQPVMKLHGEVVLNLVPREVGESVGAALDREFASQGGGANCVGDRLVFDAYRTDAIPAEDARKLLVTSLYEAFEKRGVHWTELSWSPRTYEVADVHPSETPEVRGGQEGSRGRGHLHLVKNS